MQTVENARHVSIPQARFTHSVHIKKTKTEAAKYRNGCGSTKESRSICTGAASTDSSKSGSFFSRFHTFCSSVTTSRKTSSRKWAARESINPIIKNSNTVMLSISFPVFFSLRFHARHSISFYNRQCHTYESLSHLSQKNNPHNHVSLSAA